MGILTHDISEPPIHPQRLFLKIQYNDLQSIHKKLGEIIKVLSMAQPWLKNPPTPNN